MGDSIIKTAEVEEIERELAEIKRKRVSVMEKLERYQDTHGSEYWKPYWYQEKVFEEYRNGKKIVLLVGSNQSGKTHTGAHLVDSLCSGVQQWDKKVSILGQKATKGRIICTSWESHAKETLIPKLRKVLFIDDYETEKNNLGIEAFWKHKKTGSQFTIMTHTQETKVHESDTFDWFWADEPLPRDKWTANARGLVARDGISFMSMTAVSEPWIYRELYQKMNDPGSKIAVISGIGIQENKSLTAEAIELFERSCTTEEKIARIRGGWLHLTGLIWPEFRRELHVVDIFKVPPSWPVVCMIDPHFAMEFVLNYFTVSPMGIRYMIGEQFLRPNPELVANEIIRTKKTNAWNLSRCYIDPLAVGNTNYSKEMCVEDIFTQMQKVLNPFGILIDTAKRSEEYKASGILNVKKWLMEEWGQPTLYFFNTCQQSIEMIELWCKDKEGKPLDKDDHACENLYRFTLTGTRYVDPADRNKYVFKPIKCV